MQHVPRVTQGCIYVLSSVAKWHFNQTGDCCAFLVDLIADKWGSDSADSLHSIDMFLSNCVE